MISVFQHSKHSTIKSLYKKDYLDIVYRYHILKLSQKLILLLLVLDV